MLLNVFVTSLLTLHVSPTCMGNAVFTAAIRFQLAVWTLLGIMIADWHHTMV